MFKKNKKEYENCIECDKPLSKKEIKEGASRCENCLGKKAKKTKGILTCCVAIVGTVASIAIPIITGGKKGR